MLPRRTQARLIFEPFGDELLVYDPKTHDAHHLNRAAATIWQHLEETSSMDDLARRTGLGEDALTMGLHELRRAHLLDDGNLPSQSMTRRKLLRTAGQMAAALPLVATIRAPAKAAGISCLTSGTNCTSGPQCCSGVCSGVTGQCT